MVESADVKADDAAGEHAGRLLSVSFLGLLLTQFLGATNDNILRWLVIGVGKQYVDKSEVNWILMAGTALFVLPYLLLAAPAGYLADRFSKRRVIVVCKAAEIIIMALAVVAIVLGQRWMLFTVVALMGAQSALFGPSKLGSIPEMLRSKHISAANGLIGLTTVISTMVGMAVGNWLTDATGYRGQEHWELSAVVLIGVACSGWLTSLMIQRLPIANAARHFPWDAVSQTWRDIRTLAASRAMLRVAFGIVFFWSLGALAQLNIDQFAFEGGATEQQQVTPLLIALVTGVGLGSVLAGIWSGGRVELGILPLGAGGLALSGMCLFAVEGALIDPVSELTASFVLACVFLFTLGTSAGLFDVPLAAFMQHRSPPEHRGAILAASNFLTFGGILCAAVVFGALRAPVTAGSLDNVRAAVGDDPAQLALAEQLWLQMDGLRAEGSFIDIESLKAEHESDKQLVMRVYNEVVGHPLFTSRQIFLICGVATIPVFIYIVCLIPQASIRFMAWLVTHTTYRITTHQRENLPEEGGALLAPNHVSWIDGLLLVAVSPRPVRMLISADLLTNRWLRGLARIMGAIPIRTTPKATWTAITQARDALRNDELVCVFPEGEITSSGQLQGFKPGILEIAKGTSAPVIPVYLDELWGSIFSFRSGRYFWKWPRQWPRRVSIWFGEPLLQPKSVHEVRLAVQGLGADAAAHRKQRTMNLLRTMIRKCRRALFRRKIADSTGVELTGGSLLVRTLLLRKILLSEVLESDERYVGILLPPTVAAVVTNTAVSMAGRVAANLNYTVTSDVMNACIERAQIRHVLTTRRMTEKLDFDIDAQVVYLEDYRDQITLGQKLRAALQAYLLPAAILERLLGLQHIDGDNELTVIFTSGSTGVPKGVMLTHYNIAANVEAIDNVIHLRSDDTLLGVLPFFHSFGYMVTLWAVMALDIRCVYHVDPRDAKLVGQLAEKYGVNILLATPTFLRFYLKRCTPEQFRRLEIVVAGAEKLPTSLSDAFEEKFGVRPVEGYGATELSPLVSVNVPASRTQEERVDCREGSVGKPVPGVTAKIVDPESFEELSIGTAGMLLIKGPNVMKGYLGQEEKTAEVVREGWYVTGDIAKLDEDGFIHITGRISRFSKIGGEMVPHVRVEEVIQQIIGDGDDDELRAVVTAVPDTKKGERLVVVHKKLQQSSQEIIEAIAERGLPNLWIPAADSFLEVDEIPVLGTGKLDLKGLADLAKQRMSAS